MCIVIVNCAEVQVIQNVPSKASSPEWARNAPSLEPVPVFTAKPVLGKVRSLMVG